MIPWNYTVYGYQTFDYFSDDSETTAIGTLLYHYNDYYFHEPGRSLYTADRTSKFEESIYLWHVGTGSSVATNAAFCIEASDTLNLEVVYNKESKPALGMQLCSYQGAPYKRYPKGRVAYDYYSYLWTTYEASKLFVDINRTKFCMRPRPVVYDAVNNSYAAQSIASLPGFINADPENRYVTSISFELYHGNSLPRTVNAVTMPSTYSRAYPSVDILTDRPIPSNADGAKTDMQYDFLDAQHTGWRTDVQYSPFAQANTGLWYSGDLTSQNNLYIGFRTTNTVIQLRQGRHTPAHGAKVTGGFTKLSDEIKEFDDVAYKWGTKVYYIAEGIFLDNGFPLNSLPNGNNITIFSNLEIVDAKGLNRGQALQAAIKHECAYLGFYFADNLDGAENSPLGAADDHIYLPEIVEGVTTGNYFTGAEIPGVPYAGSTSVADDAFKFSDKDEGDVTVNKPSQGNPNSIMNTGTYGSGVKYYQTTLTELKDLMTWCNTGYQPNDQDEFYRDFKGTNPSEYVTTIKFFPFELPKMSLPVPVDMAIGPLTATGAQGIPFPAQNYGNVYSFEPYLMPAFGDFRDGQTIFSVYVPFCGNMLLDPKIWAGTTLNIGLSIDYVTGTCTALLRQNGHIMETMQGTCAIDVPITLLATGDYQNYVHDKLIQASETARNRFWGGLNVAKGLIKVAGGAAVTGATFGAAAPIAAGMVTSGASDVLTGWESAAKATRQIENLEYQVDHAQPNVGVVGSASPAIGLGLPLYAQVDTYQVVFNKDYNATAYGKTVGYACLAQGTLSGKVNGKAISGFTKCTNIRLDGIAATNTERNMISELMQSGVIV